MGLVCRAIEAQGIPTVCVSTGRDITALVRPPRSLFVNHPMGNNFGRPGGVAMQTRILRAALQLVVETREPGILIDMPVDWGESFEFVIRETGKDYQLKK